MYKYREAYARYRRSWTNLAIIQAYITSSRSKRPGRREEQRRDHKFVQVSTQASLIALVANDGNLRQCVDYGELNWFSALVLILGCWQVKVAERDGEKIAFALPNGLYELQKMPSRLFNAAAVFQRLMQSTLIGFFPIHFMLYPNYIFVFGRDIRVRNANSKGVDFCNAWSTSWSILSRQIE